jgi:hypothetical protein
MTLSPLGQRLLSTNAPRAGETSVVAPTVHYFCAATVVL